ncbi:hypothetical protein I7I53_12182 [Histoplasma capsulatum var. duboisii H88]|uniref:Uncharacterized protein n=1 Tax=Ajellomyces capsulatus (strain H88) TaxID=544711 RepID=A0A8A1LUJ5_AJEC8|nr:hypothetical protein I7I53_12182 [Histoplasma capsulatum var. duboisii H88]
MVGAGSAMPSRTITLLSPSAAKDLATTEPKATTEAITEATEATTSTTTLTTTLPVPQGKAGSPPEHNSSQAHAQAMQTARLAAAGSTLVFAPVPSSRRNVTVVVDLAMRNPMTMPRGRCRERGGA